jgi:hypothetical protein
MRRTRLWVRKKMELDGSWGVSSVSHVTWTSILRAVGVALGVLIMYPILLFGVIPIYVVMYLRDLKDAQSSEQSTDDDEVR